jgi:hypothetical protein
MNPTNIVDDLIREIKERLTLDGKNRVFKEAKGLSSEFMKEKAEPEAFTKEFLIDKILDKLELEKLPEKSFETPKGHRSVDYRIKSKKGMFLVEAKPLNANLFEKSKDGGVNQIKGLFRLVEVKESYDFGVATDGLRWVFIDKNKEVVSDLKLEANFEQIKEFLVGKEKVISPETEEEISKKFYDWYNALLHGGRYKDHENKQKTVSEADCLVNNIIGVKDLEEKEQIAQVVMNRLIFIKFLQSKGIISEDILRYLSEVKEDLLTPKLRQLFFGSLDRPKDERFDIDERFKDIPYLNGSLFVHTEVERKNIDYKVRAEILKSVIEFLDSFKFVHKEQLGNGDSVDPEILGYIFERAMTATDRKGTGAYYTPKPITKYISENTIYPRIIEKTNEILKTEKGYKETELIKDIEELFILPATTLKEIWDKIILKIRVLDNACGSGAFLLAAANILFELNKKISDKIGAENPDTTLKILILVNNLYGVDINPNGIEIAKLRLWLWLADSYEPGYIKPLPNIDYNLRAGNSLIGYVDLGEFKGARLTLSDFLQDEEKPTLDNLLKERNDLICEYKITWGEEAKEFKSKVQEFDEKINNLLNADLYREFREKKIEISREEFLKLNPFHWGFEFYEVFELDKPKEERGFDVVIGNPPYVKLHNIDKISLKYFFEHYKTAEKKCDLYAFFTERVLKFLLRNKGLLGYIISNTWLNLDSFTNLRRIVAKDNRLIQIVTLDNPFSKVTVTPIIFFVEKVHLDEYKFLFSHFDIFSQCFIDKREISSETIFPRGYVIDLTISEDSLKILNKISQQSIALENITKLQYGIMTADNEKFVVSEPKTDCHKPLLSGEDIRRFYVNWLGNRYVDYRPEEMKKKKTARPGEPGRFERDKKIVFQRYSSTKLIATLDTSQFYTLGTTIIGYSTSQYSNEYLLGLINSKLLSWWYGRAFTSPTNYIREFEILPVRTINFSDPVEKAWHEKMVKLVEQMLELHERLTKTTTETDKAMLQRQIGATDQEIDNLVYQLYELTQEEIAIVEGSSK